MGLRSIELCAGYGGLGLGIELAVPCSRSVCLVEREGFLIGQLVQAMEEGLMAQAPIHSNVRTFDGKPWRGKVDCVTGGYPCQPFSIAGKRLGTADPRHLWPDIFRIVNEVQPAICFFENVDDHLNMGYEQVHADLERVGYVVEAGIFSSAETGATHVRERLYILAYRGGDRLAVPSRRERNAGAKVRGVHGPGGGNRAIGDNVGGPSVSMAHANAMRRLQQESGESDERGRDSDSSRLLGSPKSLRGEAHGERQEQGEDRGASDNLAQKGVVLDDALCRRYVHPEQEIFAGRLPIEPPGRHDESGWGGGTLHSSRARSSPRANSTPTSSSGLCACR